MTISSTNFVAELQYWFNNFVTNSSVNKNKVKFPSTVNTYILPQKSFIELLFNENYSYSEYYYKYAEKTDKSTWSSQVLQRMMIYPESAKYYFCDSTGENLFQLQSEDLTLLNALLQYRIDSTSVSIIDSTSISFINNVLYASYDNISRNLAKLIFVYLDLKINRNISYYNNQTIIADESSSLESMYELYVLDKIFDLISSRGT